MFVLFEVMLIAYTRSIKVVILIKYLMPKKCFDINIDH